MISHESFREWLENPETASDLPLVAWDYEHTEIAVRFAQEMARRAVNRTLDEALNTGDGSYKP